MEWVVSRGLSNHGMISDNCEAAISRAVGVGVFVGGSGVFVGGIGVAVGGIGVAVGGTSVAVAVGVGVFVGGTGVAVAVGDGVLVGGTGVAVAVGVLVGGTGVAVGVLVGGTGVGVAVDDGVARGSGAASAARGGSSGAAVWVGETGESPQATAATATPTANMHAQSMDERLDALLASLIMSCLGSPNLVHRITPGARIAWMRVHPLVDLW